MAPDPSTTNTTSVEEEEDQGKDDLFELTLLPNELLEKVFNHLDLRTFKSIRQVCQLFRDVADTKESLANFCIAVRPKRSRLLPDLLSLTESFPWSHLFLDHFDPSELQQGNSALVKNLEKLALLLKARKQRTGFGLKSITCPLRVDYISTSSNFYTLQPFILHCYESLERVGSLRMTEIRLKLLPALKTGGVMEFPTLSFLQIAFDLDIEYCGTELLMMLELCPKLRRLELMFADQDEHPMSRDSFETAVLCPILSYLDQRRKTAAASGQTAKPFTVNFASEGDRASIPFNFNALERLLAHSKSRPDCKTGIHLSLESVPFLALPTKRSLAATQTQDPDILERLNYTVKSIMGTMHDLKLSTMEIERDSFHSSCRHFMPPESKFSLVVYLPTGNKIYLTCPVQLLPKDVQSITIVSENTRASLLLSISDEDNQWGEDKNKSFIEDLLVWRPGLHELRIVTQNDKKLDLPFLTQDSANFKHIGSFKNFPNLKVLHLDFWGRQNADFWELYESLPLLEKLVLKKCYRLKDESIVGLGDGANSMLQLRNLKHLVLDGYWSITDVSFIQVFSKLPLQTLHVWDDPDKTEKSISLKALISLPNSICGGTLELLKINKPVKSSLSDVKKSLVKCRSLKRVELLEEAGAGSKTTKNVILF